METSIRDFLRTLHHRKEEADIVAAIDRPIDDVEMTSLFL